MIMENSIGKRIAMLRKQNGWSQAELAAMLNVSDKSVSKWENGGLPSVDLFPQLSKVFNVSIDYLMLGDGARDVEAEDEEAASDFDCAAFEESIRDLEVEDLHLILVDQRELYTAAELQVILARYEELGGTEPVVLEDRAEGSQYEDDEDEDNFITAREVVEEEEYEGLGCLGYLVTLLFPIIGLIWAIVKNDRGVILFAVILFIIQLILSFTMLGSIAELLGAI